ncbi:MAG: chorismate synthase [Rickettsiales bacterium]
MSYNVFGNVFRFTTWGESHGPEIGCVVDGTPPGLALSEEYVQRFLDERRPGQSAFTTQRKEPDRVRIVSGVFNGVTTGTPIAMLIENVDTRSKDYGDIAERFRPGHADYTYAKKYGVRDYRGGGRSSARETAMRVAAGAVARKILGDDVSVRGALCQMGELTAGNPDAWRWEEVKNNPFFCPAPHVVPEWEEYLKDVRKSGSSVGAAVIVQAHGVPPGWGAPIYRKLDAELASALMSINAVKGVEIGEGMGAARLRGEGNADEMRCDDKGDVVFLSNHAGGILGGISTGQPITARFAVKPTSSILIPTQSVTSRGENVEVITKGRHDPCVGIRAVPVGEAMVACVLADHKLMHRAQCG